MHRAGLVVAVVLTCFAALAAPGAATPQSRSCLAPSGGDDTALLQAALDRCSGAGLHCKVDLCAGVFETGILRVGDFRGRLRGAGARATTLRALPDSSATTRWIPIRARGPTCSSSWRAARRCATSGC